MSSIIHHPSSYRDPSGFIFEKDGVLYRQVNLSFKEHFDHFIQGGCYEEFVKKELLIPHELVSANLTGSGEYYATIKPERIGFLSWPYEWSFDMLRDAALLTLRLAKESLRFNMILKDASPYNIQWHKGRLIFIDTLSFEKYEEVPWIAYRQFCESFLAPLLIMNYSRKQLPELLLAWPNGIPLTTAASLLPSRSRLSLHTYLHIHLHARLSERKGQSESKPMSLSKQKLLNLLSSLELLIGKLKTPQQKSTWSEYYEEASMRSDYLEQKKRIVTGWIEKLKGVDSATDLGANEGEFSKIAASKNIRTIAADFDPYCINNLYLQIKKDGQKNIQPMVLDLANPTPAIGVNNEERSSFNNRYQTDLVLALALVHHLAIGKNIPLDTIAAMHARGTKYLVIEFVPKTDEKITLMLKRKKDIYANYTEENFVRAFERYFQIIDKAAISNSGRVLYLMQR